ncbi:MAG: type II toxin-antitoxin system VapC family toxin [Deltaproteobacteria bacterium]|nr:type II toxin-antitoxin system VapC family toxin [Deltaproteobacteria bacterium]
MKAVDTSVIVAGFASWHESHTPARRALDEHPSLIGHCALETYSVLTRLPAPHRAPPRLVAQFLAVRFPGVPLTLPGAAQLELVARLAAAGISGGAVYDALVGATAAHHGATLLTLDGRAQEIYERLRVKYVRLG